MLIFKGSQVIKYYVMFAFLFVQSVYIYANLNLGHDNSFFKERSGREGMTVVSVLLGAAVEVGVGSNPTIAK